MNSSLQKIEQNFAATKVWFDGDSLCVALADGREIKTPVDFYPRLRDATKKQRESYQLIGLGTGIHWPEIDEDLSVDGIVLGIPARF